MIWVAIEDANTSEISDFKGVSEAQVLDLMTEYRVDKHDATRFRMQDMESDRNYEGVTYTGAFGCNLWVASKYTEM